MALASTRGFLLLTPPLRRQYSKKYTQPPIVLCKDIIKNDWVSEAGIQKMSSSGSSDGEGLVPGPQLQDKEG